MSPPNKPKNPRRGSTRRLRSRVSLDDLAQFQVLEVNVHENGRIPLKGVFTHLVGVRAGMGLLYVSRPDSIYGDLTILNPKTREATFLAWPGRTKIKVGLSFPYVDRYWDAADVARALEPASNWKRTLFKPVDLVRYRDPAVPGWWKSHVASAAVSDGATDVHIIKEGWDHEHCHLCRRKIGRGGARFGFYSPLENQWLCERCYKRHISRHDLSFVQFK